MAIIIFLPLVATMTSCLCFISAFTSTLYLLPNGSETWTNNDESVSQTVRFTDDSLARFILLTGQNADLQTGLCFYCSSSAEDKCYLSVILLELHDEGNSTNVEDPPQVVWTANRNSHVGRDATLKLYSGGLVLKDADGNNVWISPTLSKSTGGITISTQGNVVLFDRSNGTVWQSFDHPTDTLLVGQTLSSEGECLTSGTSSVNQSLPLFRLCVYISYLAAFIEVERSTQYLIISPPATFSTTFQLRNVTLNLSELSFVYLIPVSTISTVPNPIPLTLSAKFLRLDDDGGVRIYGWDSIRRWQANSNIFDSVEECQFPLKCGRYGVCQRGQAECTCPVAVDAKKYFEFINSQSPEVGCRQKASLSMQTSSENYLLINFGRLSYFSYLDPSAAIPELDTEESCKKTCLDNATCKAAFFMFSTNASQGDCYLPSEILSIINHETSIGRSWYNTSSYIKVLRPHSTSYFRKLVTHLIFYFLLFLIFSSFALWLFLKHKNRNWEISQGSLEKLSRVVLRFSYDELCSATGKFAEPLGEGGFGMVFRGVLGDGTLVALKRLDKVGQGTKEFLAEVETVGSIHHVSVVKLIGFCVEKRQKMLVYEYMSNGSLEKWIFDDSKSISLDWEMRKKILLDIAKGLAYLHEDCRQRIAHLDVKPENILLDEHFKAKLSDFGMSKVIKRDESRVMTGIRGTMGYLAPEWQKTGITVKADIYSYGIVLLEVISGRKNLDYSLTESDVHLLSMLQKKFLENRLMDIVVRPNEDMQYHSEEVIRLIRLGMWCLDEDYRRRPSMSVVVMVLEGVIELQANISCNLPFVATPPLGSTVSSSSSMRASRIREKISSYIS